MLDILYKKTGHLFDKRCPVLEKIPYNLPI
jgi:hypothetical protein